MSKTTISDRFVRLRARALRLWQYCSAGVWDDHRDTLAVNSVKTVNLAVRTFLSTDLQTKACAMTYRTLLAIVPALALLFAIGRGFGFQTLLENEVYRYFPSQHRALEMAFSFVDSCLAQASGGIFVGVGIVFLIWTIVALLSSVEETFNQVWGVTVERSIFRKITDYLAICIILPVLMICSGGVQIFMSNAIQRLLPFDFIPPMIEVLLDCASVVFAWLFFAGAYMLIPNIKVKFKNAIVSGVIAGTAFQLLQWVFVSGQVYVAKYNAIYGSFSFLPIMLIWMQFSWLITLAGALICCAAQNISMFTFSRRISGISFDYRRMVTVAVTSIILKRFRASQPPLNASGIAETYHIPPTLAESVVDWLLKCGLAVRVAPDSTGEITSDLPIQPSMSIEHYTLRFLLDKLRNHGDSDFIPDFENNFPGVVAVCQNITDRIDTVSQDTLVADL